VSSGLRRQNAGITTQPVLRARAAAPSATPAGAPKNGDVAKAPLHITAASATQQWLVGKQWGPEKGGVSHPFLAATKTATGTKELHRVHEKLSEVDNVILWNDALKAAPADGQLAYAAITRRYVTGDAAASKVHGILYADNLHNAKSGPFNEADMQMLTTTALLLAEALEHLAFHADGGAGTDKKLAVESVVGEERILFLKKVWEKVTADVKGITKDQLSEMARYNSPPAIIPQVTGATLIVVGTKPKAVATWDDMRKRLKQALLDKICAFDPTSLKVRKPFFMRAKKQTRGLSANDVFTKGSLPASCFYSWTHITILLRKAADALRKKAAKGELDEATDGRSVASTAVDDDAAEAEMDAEGVDDLGDDGDDE